MILAIIKNLDGSLDYIKLENNILVCDNYSKNGVVRRNDNYIDKFFSVLHYNENCVYIDKYKDYDVYFDEKTNLKHFIKNGKEDLDLFIKFNTENALLNEDNDVDDEDDFYEDELEDAEQFNPIPSGCVKFFAGSMAIIMAIGIFTYEYKTHHKGESVFTPTTSYSTLNQQISKEEALELLKNSDIDPEIIDFLVNEDLFSDVFKYYEDSPYSYTTELKFNGLHVERFNNNDQSLLGKYNPLTPNVIYINDDIHDPDIINTTAGHEFVHLLQAEGCNYYYLLESTAELMNHEYYNANTDSYTEAIENLKILINTIGPEPIMKLVFASDDTEFKEIIRSNLSEYEAHNLISLLQTESRICSVSYSEIHTQIRSLLANLYKSIHGEDPYYNFICNTDESIQKDFFDDDTAYYINWRKMDQSRSISLVADAKYLLDNGYLKEQTIYKYDHKIDSVNEYNEMKSENNVRFDVYDTTNDDGKLPGIFNYDEDKYYLFDTPLNGGEYYESDGYYSLNSQEYPNGHYIELEEAMQRGLVTVYAVVWSPENDKYQTWNIGNTSVTYVSTNDEINIKDSSSYSIRFSITVPSIKERFPDQYNNLSKIESKKIN